MRPMQHRLLSLCSLAAEAAEIPYKDVSDALQIEIGEVEQWIVQAITAGLIKARMDQQRQVTNYLGIRPSLGRTRGWITSFLHEREA